MNLFQSNLRHLLKENDAAIANIENAESKAEISRMISYLSASSLPLFQIEVIRKDLAGMALEADQENLTLTKKLGISTKEFCDGIIQDTDNYPAKKEHLFQELVNLFWSMTAFYAFEYIFLYSAPAAYGIKVTFIAWALIYFLAIRFLSGFLKNKFSLNDRFFKRYLYMITNLIGIILYIVMVSVFYKNYRVFLIQGNGWLILALMLLASVAVTLLMNQYFNRCSQEYNY